MKRTVSLFLVFVYSVASLVGTHGLVLCYGADGHVEVEVAVNGGCGPFSITSDPGDFNGNLANALGEHCGPCVDVPIVFSNYDVSRHLAEIKASKASSDFVCLASQLSAWKIQAITPSLSPKQPSHPSFSLESLRTVVLLI